MKLGIAVALMLMVVGGLGCGSGASSSADTVAAKKPLYPWLKGPSREFLVPGGDNVVQTFGEEGTPKQRAEATAVIAAWLRARAAKDLRKDCSYFSRTYAKLLTNDARGVTEGKVKSCPEALDYFKGHASGTYENTLTGSIDSLRVGEGLKVGGEFGEMAFAQYHGNDGKDWVVPLEPEDGEWKIGKAAPINRLR